MRISRLPRPTFETVLTFKAVETQLQIALIKIFVIKTLSIVTRHVKTSQNYQCLLSLDMSKMFMSQLISWSWLRLTFGFESWHQEDIKKSLSWSIFLHCQDQIFETVKYFSTSILTLKPCRDKNSQSKPCQVKLRPPSLRQT